MLALWHKKFGNNKLSLQAAQSAANEKEKILYTLSGNKVQNKWEDCHREMIYRFNDSAHYLFWISFPLTTRSSFFFFLSHTQLPFPQHQVINKQKAASFQHKHRTGSSASTHSRSCSFIYSQSHIKNVIPCVCLPSTH